MLELSYNFATVDSPKMKRRQPQDGQTKHIHQPANQPASHKSSVENQSTTMNQD